MKSVVLVPYCPLPADTGGKREMWKHLEVLRSLGECKIVSASTRPVGTGWTRESRDRIEKMGYSVTLREESCGRSAIQLFGVGYAAICIALGLERAFGHSNPYHRYAFQEEWWRKCTEGADLALINYSYWAWLPCSCPKVVVLLDLWSDYMWENERRETRDLAGADAVIVISKDEEVKLNKRGIAQTLWSPPSVPKHDLPLPPTIGLVGSANKFNIEGLRWLERSGITEQVHVYGELADYVSCNQFVKRGRYHEDIQPYRECGVILLPTAGGMGMQIKVIEALACGRAIVARKGAMRGLPGGEGAWIEVESPEKMANSAQMLKSDPESRVRLAEQARAYYMKHLNSTVVNESLRNSYLRFAGQA